MHPLLAIASPNFLPFHPAWLIIAAAVTLVGLTKSGFGAGVGLIIVPITVIGMSYVPPEQRREPLGLLLPLLIAGDLLALFQYRHLLDASLLKRLAVPTLVGVVIGGFALYGLHKLGERSATLAATLIRLEIGLESVILVSIHYYTRWKRADGKVMAEPGRSWLAGTYAAVSSTVAHAAGPVIGLYLLPLKLPRQAFVGTSAAYFFALNSLKLPAYYRAGQFDHLSWGLTLGLLPLVFFGAVLGRLMIKRINDKTFSQVVYVSTFAIGLYLVIDALVHIA